MPALTIKNIPTNLYNELKHVAEQHHRSINSEVIFCLKNYLFPKKILSEETYQYSRSREQAGANAKTLLPL